MKENWMERFINEAVPLLRQDFQPELILLFGSYAKGSASEDSDLDIILVSHFFENMRFIERMSFVSKKVRFPRHVDYLCYTPEEFQRIQGNSIIVREAVREGIPL
ncbi:MAG: nucleotidyltransferase domain-containing protein [Anaerolineae bacterium]